jgi:hypothetical protein
VRCTLLKAKQNSLTFTIEVRPTLLAKSQHYQLPSKATTTTKEQPEEEIRGRQPSFATEGPVRELSANTSFRLGKFRVEVGLNSEFDNLSLQTTINNIYLFIFVYNFVLHANN